jgi:predicted MPP superfamily phosphohydrolase
VFGENQKRLVKEVKTLEPDLVVLTGDMVDGDVESIETHLAFLKDLTDETPVYAVSGNHEYWSASSQEVKTVYDTLGVTSLEDECLLFSESSQPIKLCGISDYEKFSDFQDYRETIPKPEENTFNILLAHRPVYFDTYASFDYDLVLSGHAHGGMIRLPFIGGLYAPDQGFFPSYTTGPYIEDGTTMIVSRGLGNSVFPFRIQNRPEIIAITLENK